MLGLDAGMSHRNIKRCLDTFEITSELGSETTIRMGLIDLTTQRTAVDAARIHTLVGGMRMNQKRPAATQGWEGQMREPHRTPKTPHGRKRSAWLC